jgi:hypothetical protein
MHRLRGVRCARPPRIFNEPTHSHADAQILSPKDDPGVLTTDFHPAIVNSEEVDIVGQEKLL